MSVVSFLCLNFLSVCSYPDMVCHVKKNSNASLAQMIFKNIILWNVIIPYNLFWDASFIAPNCHMYFCLFLDFLSYFFGLSLFDKISDAYLRHLTTSAKQLRKQQHLFWNGLESLEVVPSYLLCFSAMLHVC